MTDTEEKKERARKNAHPMTLKGLIKFVKDAQATGVKKKHTFGDGLRIEVTGGAVRWVFSYTYGGKQLDQSLKLPSRPPESDRDRAAQFIKELGILTIVEAQEWRAILRAAKDRGDDAKAEYARVTGAVAAPTKPVETLRDNMHQQLHDREGETRASSNREMVQLMERHATALLGMEPSRVTHADVLKVMLAPAQIKQGRDQGKPVLDASGSPMTFWDARRDSAERVLVYGGMIWTYSEGSTGKVNPFSRDGLIGKGKLRSGGKPEQRHHPAIKWQDVAAFFAELGGRRETEARALQLLLLTCCPRTDEVLNAKWGEIAGNRWNVPRTKERLEGRVIPLSLPAQELLMSIRPMTGVRPDDWIFPARVRCVSGLMDEGCMQDLLKKMRTETGAYHATVHGLRSSMMDWVGDRHPLLLMSADLALDHRIGGKVQQAYLRTGMVDNRRGLADLWAEHLMSAIRKNESLAAA